MWGVPACYPAVPGASVNCVPGRGGALVPTRPGQFTFSPIRKPFGYDVAPRLPRSPMSHPNPDTRSFVPIWGMSRHWAIPKPTKAWPETLIPHF